jgi:hypothetical protein
MRRDTVSIVFNFVNLVSFVVKLIYIVALPPYNVTLYLPAGRNGQKGLPVRRRLPAALRLAQVGTQTGG